mmetsp:Transcript_45366/g.83979  ORF Transcript_45366/g.83979 Transcript_45366/m.83979 type:complete len:270 (+) Transcript_45366:1002-1811(+)
MRGRLHPPRRRRGRRQLPPPVRGPKDRRRQREVGRGLRRLLRDALGRRSHGPRPARGRDGVLGSRVGDTRHLSHPLQRASGGRHQQRRVRRRYGTVLRPPRRSGPQADRPGRSVPSDGRGGRAAQPERRNSGRVRSRLAGPRRSVPRHSHQRRQPGRGGRRVPEHGSEGAEQEDGRRLPSDGIARRIDLLVQFHRPFAPVVRRPRQRERPDRGGQRRVRSPRTLLRHAGRRRVGQRVPGQPGRFDEEALQGDELRAEHGGQGQSVHVLL